MAEIKSSESDYDSKPNAIAEYNGKRIIDADPTAIVSTAEI